MTREQRGIQSIEVGGQLLRVLTAHGAPMMLRDLAGAAGMSAAKAHPYLVSYGKIGLVEQDQATGHYALGPLALQLGLVSLKQLNPLRVAGPAITALSREIEHSVAIAVLGNLGPTIVGIEDSNHPIHVNLRAGSVMSMLNTATGLVFAAFLPPKIVAALIERESSLAVGFKSHKKAPWARIEAALDDVRRHGMARADGRPIPGINAFSAPIFDHSGAIALAITAMGPAGTFDVDWGGPIAKAIRACAEAVSRRLGYMP